MQPRNEDNFLIEVPPAVYDEMKKYLSEEEESEIELHYSPYWKQLSKERKDQHGNSNS